METANEKPAQTVIKSEANVVDLITQSFPAFDHRGIIANPFDKDAKSDDEFREKLSNMLLELMLEFHAWSTSRPVQESDRTADVLEKEINNIMETEIEQEKTRQKLNDFINRIKVALAALADL